MPDLDKYEQTEPFASSEVTTSEASFDPYSQAEPVESSRGSLNESVERKHISLGGVEAKVAKFSPNLYATGATVASLFPYATKLLLPSARDEFMQLNQEEQTMSLLEDALGAALWGRSTGLGKDISYLFNLGVKTPFKTLTNRMGTLFRPKTATIIPYEDAVKRIGELGTKEPFMPFSYGEEVKKRLITKGFAQDEAEAVTSSLLGEEGGLLDVIINRKYVGKGMTKAFEKATSWEQGRLYPKRVLNSATMEEFGENSIRGGFYTRKFEETLVNDVLKAKPAKTTVKAIFEAQLKRTFPEKLVGEGTEKIGFGDLTPHQTANLFLDMLENKAVSWQVTYPTLMATLHPARVVFGIGDEALGTMKGIYTPIKAALGRMNRNYFNHSLLWSKMGEQRGIYKSVVIKENGEFVATKADWLTPKVQDEAYGVMRIMDDLSGVIAKAESKGNEAAVLEAQQAISQATNGISEEAKILISAWRSYSDHLYSEHVKMQIPRLFRKAGLTRVGQAKVDEFMSGSNGLNYEIDRLFSTISETNPTDKITGMKNILDGLKQRLEFSGPDHPYFTSKGDDLAKLIKGLGKEFSYKKEGFLRYHDNYVARVSKHEDILLQKWRGGLFEGRSAFYTKIRELEKMKGDPVDFGTMIQARTMAHAKEHFLYDKLDEVVRFTKKLPPAWVEYTEGYLGGILGTPTLSDYKVAMFLTKTTGGLERFFGKGEGLWSEQRVANLAYTMNNMAYLGGLGFKPFSALRNLFQPLLTVPTDMGGVKDLGKLVEGYKWAANPANRKYLVDIGAIEEYAPEIYLRPRILPQGRMFAGKELPTMEGARDAAMWMFKASDRYNRYVTGGAAVIKWDRTFKSFNNQIKPNEVTAFGRKMNLGGRYEWVKADIEDKLLRGKISEAKAVYVKDVIADTQYLYGIADAPVILRKHGALGRTGFLFQSWWMNYGSTMQKWLVRGESPGLQFERMTTAMLSQGLAYSMMEPLWGQYTAIRSTGLGPFPTEFNEFLIPPTWKPVAHAGMAMINIQRPEVSAGHAKAVLDSSMILVPAGLQMKSFYKGAKEEGFEGFSKAIIGMKPKRGED